MKHYFMLFMASLVSTPAMAFFGQPSGIGGVANNMMDPVTLFSDVIYTGCLVVGASFVFASVVKYFEHRRSPLMVPLSTVVFLAIAGIVLLILPFMSYFYGGALRYTFFS